MLGGLFAIRIASRDVSVPPSEGGRTGCAREGAGDVNVLMGRDAGAGGLACRVTLMGIGVTPSARRRPARRSVQLRVGQRLPPFPASLQSTAHRTIRAGGSTPRPPRRRHSSPSRRWPGDRLCAAGSAPGSCAPRPVGKLKGRRRPEVGAIEARAGSFDRVLREFKISHDVTARALQLTLLGLVDRRTTRNDVRSTLEKVLDLVGFRCRRFAKCSGAAGQGQVEERRGLRHFRCLQKFRPVASLGTGHPR
ncbi:hypothetical protein XI09_26325 [Bradyrhizobium sp. CCBAU 11386]|nr:hypothetical protein [Bradyrhizobium sp. CCBAU 11386]